MLKNKTILVTGGTGSFGHAFVSMTLKKYNPKKIDPATKTFQAIRIFINAEDQELRAGLEHAFAALAIGGRLAVISFHSLEDRQVKHVFRGLSRPPSMPRRLPVRHSDQGISARLIGKSIKAQSDELATNPRARSATLRVIERIC